MPPLTAPVHDSHTDINLREQGENKAKRIAGKIDIDQSLSCLIIAVVPADPVEHPKTE